MQDEREKAMMNEDVRKKWKPYRRLSDKARAEVKKWYGELWEHEDKRYWLAATLMLQFAMCDKDVQKMNGEYVDGEKEFRKRCMAKMYLKYTPCQTANSSGSKVVWPIHPEIWQRIVEDALKRGAELAPVVPKCRDTLKELNKMLGAAVPELSKSRKPINELRKIRIEAEYRNHGVERASALSGEDMESLSYIYGSLDDYQKKACKLEDMI